MKSIKNKLSSKSGASMLLALVFLLFCLMVGGSVLSAATANGSRAAQKKVDQQAYLSQRSASLLLADMLKSTEDSAMQLTIKEVGPENSEDVSDLDITVTAHGVQQKSYLQRLLYDLAVKKYLADNGARLSGLTVDDFKYVNFNFKDIASQNYSSSNPETKGKIILLLTENEKTVDSIDAWYSTNEDGNFLLTYTNPSDSNTQPTAEGETQPAEAPQHSYVTLSMKCYIATSNPVVVNGNKTITTIIRWDDPVIEKGGA